MAWSAPRTPEASRRSRKPPRPLVRGVLNPLDRAAEVLFGLIMALTITGALSVSGATAQETRALFVSTLACNIAWGIVDGVMYVLNALFERGRQTLVSGALRENPSGEPTPDLLEELLPEPWVETLGPGEMQALRGRLARLPEPPPPRVQSEDLLGGLGVCILVIGTTVPVALPFLVLEDARTAMAVSRALSLILLFLGGYSVGRYAGLRPVAVGLAMLGIGGVLVAIVTALGG